MQSVLDVLLDGPVRNLQLLLQLQLGPLLPPPPLSQRCWLWCILPEMSEAELLRPVVALLYPRGNLGDELLSPLGLDVVHPLRRECLLSDLLAQLRAADRPLEELPLGEAEVQR